MKNEILVYSALFFLALFLGFIFGVYYEIFRFLRLAFPHPKSLVFAEDLLFWIPCALVTILFCYAFFDGVIRWFAIAGILCGFLLYLKTLGAFLIRVSATILQAIRKALKWIFRTFFLPVWKFFKKLSKSSLRKQKSLLYYGKESGRNENPPGWKRSFYLLPKKDF